MEHSKHTIFSKLLKAFVLSSILLLLLTSTKCYGQKPIIEINILTDAKNTMFGMDMGANVANKLFNNNLTYVGVKVQTWSIIPKLDRDDDNSWQTESTFTMFMQGGANHYIKLANIKQKDNHSIDIGLVPDARLYFCPYLPRNLNFYDNEHNPIELHTQYQAALFYGISLGISIKDHFSSSSVLLKFEYSNIDVFKAIRKENKESDFNFPSAKQWSIGIALWI